jgi:NADH-quinone oxidoreductase subunit D
MAADIPSGWMDGLRQFTRTFPHTLDEIDRVLTRNAIWVGRTVGLGVMTPEEAINWGLSGPMLRASGVDYDVRKDFPYLDYETYDFEVPVGTNGDVYDRYLVRFEEFHRCGFFSRRLTGCQTARSTSTIHASFFLPSPRRRARWNP